MKIKTLVLIAVSILFTGCVSVKRDGYFVSTLETKPDSASVYFYRPKTTLMLSPRLKIANREEFNLPRNSFFHVYLPEGQHDISVIWSFGAGPESFAKSINVKNGETYIYRSFVVHKKTNRSQLILASPTAFVMPEFDWIQELKLTDFESSAGELKQCREVEISKTVNQHRKYPWD